MSELSPAQIEELRKAADAAAEHAYAPYSGFRVGAALLFDDGAIVAGCNIENISYGLSICAERAAMVRAIAESGAKRKIVAVLVTNLNQAASPPCGACRQFLSEFATEDTVVYFANADGSLTSKLLTELLPFSFADWKADARR